MRVIQIHILLGYPNDFIWAHDSRTKRTNRHLNRLLKGGMRYIINASTSNHHTVRITL